LIVTWLQVTIFIYIRFYMHFWEFTPLFSPQNNLFSIV
jgi:hypothetical protein